MPANRCCNCACAEVRLEAWEAGYGYFPQMPIVASMAHSQDCYNQGSPFLTSGSSQSPVTRFFSFQSGQNTFTVTALGASNTEYEHIGWLVDYVNGEREWFITREPLALEINNTDAGPPPVGEGSSPNIGKLRVRALYIRGGIPPEDLLACDSAEVEAPSMLRLDLPSTLKLSMFEESDTGSCRSIADHFFQLLGGSPLFLSCAGWVGDDLIYNWVNGAGVCAEVRLRVVWRRAEGGLPNPYREPGEPVGSAWWEHSGHTNSAYNYERLPTPANPTLNMADWAASNYNYLHYFTSDSRLWVAGCQAHVNINLWGRFRTEYNFRSREIPISQYFTAGALRGALEARPEIAAFPDTDTGTTVGILGTFPLRKYQSLGGSLLPGVNGILSLSLSPFYFRFHGSYRYNVERAYIPRVSTPLPPPYVFSYGGELRPILVGDHHIAPCQNISDPGPGLERGSPTNPSPTFADMVAHLSERLAPTRQSLLALDPKRWFPFASVGSAPNNIGMNLSLLAVGSGTNDQQNCKCFLSGASNNLPKSSLLYFAPGYDLPPGLETCVMECGAGLTASDVFPRVIKMTLPDTIDLTWRRSSLGDMVSYSRVLDRHPSLPAVHYLTTDCSLFARNNSTPDAYAASAWTLNQTLGSGELRALTVEYRLDPPGNTSCVHTIIRIDVGWVTQTVPPPCGPDTVGVARLFTACRFIPLKLGAVATHETFAHQFCAVNLGPEFLISDFSSDELNFAYAKTENPWGWEPIFVFQNFGMANALFAHLPPPADAPGGGLGPDHPPSMAPGFFNASRARRIEGYGDTLSTFCPGWDADSCLGPGQGVPYREYCGTLAPNVLFPFIVEGLGNFTIPDSLGVCQPATVEFITYV